AQAEPRGPRPQGHGARQEAGRQVEPHRGSGEGEQESIAIAGELAGMDATKHFSTRDAARILQVTEARVRSWARLGGLEPAPGPDGRSEFTFQQLLLLRTTRGLIDAGIPPRRVRRIWSSLRRQLAADLPLTSVRILASGERAIAWDENASWQPDSGQFLLDFDAGEIEAVHTLAAVAAPS